MSDAIPDIWHYARCLDKSLSQLEPEDIQVHCTANTMHISCTITTLPEADAVCALIQLLCGKFSAARVGIPADIEPQEPSPSPLDEAMRLLGASP